MSRHDEIKNAYRGKSQSRQIAESEEGLTMHYNGFYYALFQGTMKKVLAEQDGKDYAKEIMGRAKPLYKKLGVMELMPLLCELDEVMIGLQRSGAVLSAAADGQQHEPLVLSGYARCDRPAGEAHPQRGAGAQHRL